MTLHVEQLEDTKATIDQTNTWLNRLIRRSGQSYWGMRKNTLIPHEQIELMWQAHTAFINARKELQRKCR